MTNLPNWINQVIVIGVVVGAGYYFVRGSFRLLRPNPELLWREVPGQIVTSLVDDSGKAKSANIRYLYKVDGDQFEGKKIAPIELWASFSTSAADSVRKYPSGREVTVFVNPRRPRRSVLEPQHQPIAAVCLLLLGVFLTGFAWLWWMLNFEPVA